MRPIPQNRHLLATAILAAAAALAGYLAVDDQEVSVPQVHIASAALKRHDPSRFANDPIFGQAEPRPTRPAATQAGPAAERMSPPELWLFHTPAYQSMLELVLVPTGYRDLLLGFRVGTAVQTLLLLAGMYAILFWQTRSWSVSVFTAILAARIIEMPGGGTWGSGSLASATPAGLCLAAWPLVVLAFARYSRPQEGRSPTAQWRVIFVFVAVGLLGNLHLVTAMNMTLVLLIAYVVRQRFSPRCLPIALAAGGAALLAALPYVWYYFSLRAQLSAGQAMPEPGTVKDAIRAGGLTVLYPELLMNLLDWRMLVGVIVLGVPSATVLVKVERYLTQNIGLWVGLFAGAVLVSMGLHGLLQFLAKKTATAPLVIDFVQAGPLLMLPLYVLLGQAITNLFRIFRGHRATLRWALTALLGLWMVPADNLRAARWQVAEAATSFLSEDSKPEYVLRHREENARRRELRAIADFARRKDGAVFITDHDEFRMLARSAIAVGPRDVRYLYYLAPQRIDGWLKFYEKQDALLNPSSDTADGKDFAHFVNELIASRPAFARAAEWYVLLEPTSAPADLGPLQPIESERWGKHYKLFRVR